MRASAQLRVGYFARTGRSHSRLEDCILIGNEAVVAPTPRPVTRRLTQPYPLGVAVFDGVGGHLRGHRASAVAACELAEDVRGFERGRATAELPEALQRISALLNDERQQGGARSMGTTVAGILIDDDGATGFNVGDSRVYVTRDRYLCAWSVDDVAVRSHASGAITQCLGAGLEHVDPHIRPLVLDEGSAALICSDGLYRHLSLDEIEGHLSRPEGLLRLFEATEGAADDVSVAFISVSAPSIATAAPAMSPAAADVQSRGVRASEPGTASQANDTPALVSPSAGDEFQTPSSRKARSARLGRLRQLASRARQGDGRR